MLPLDVTILAPQTVIFEGKAQSVIVPGEQGQFEIQPFHKRIISRLMSGMIIVDGESFPIKRGIVKVNQNRVVVIIEESL